jgi:hypothetical protein
MEDHCGATTTCAHGASPSYVRDPLAERKNVKNVASFGRVTAGKIRLGGGGQVPGHRDCFQCGNPRDFGI